MNGKQYHLGLLKEVNKKSDPTLESARINWAINKMVDAHNIVRECCYDYNFSTSTELDSKLTEIIKKKGNLCNNLTKWGHETIKNGTCIITLNGVKNRVNFWLNISDIIQETMNKYWRWKKEGKIKQIITHFENNILDLLKLLDNICLHYANNMKKIDSGKYCLLTNKIGIDLGSLLLKREGEILTTASEIICLDST